MTKAHRHLDPHSYDKRNYHGALTKVSPFYGGGAECVGCQRHMSRIEVAACGTVCRACRDEGWMTPEEYNARRQG